MIWAKVRAQNSVSATTSNSSQASDTPQSSTAPGGAIVTLRRDGVLRARMARMLDQRIVDAVRSAAALAIRGDPRFPPISREELAGLEVELSVLGPPVPLEDPLDFEPGRHGLLLRSGDGTGLLLPQVAASGLLLVSVAQLMGTALTTEFVFGLQDSDDIGAEAAVFFGHWIGTVPWLWAGAG